MKRKLLTVLIAFMCAVTFLSGCGLGSFIENNKPKDPTEDVDPDNPDNPDNPDDPEQPVVNNNYTVSVYYNNKLFNPGTASVNAVWRGDSEIKRVALGADGKADAGELDGDYKVYLEGLPSTYTYNPGAYTATADERKVTILLSAIKTPESGDGKGLYADQGCYSVRYDGTYRANITKEGEYLYYQYTPTAAGWYTIESWVSAYDDEINPIIQTYAGSHAFKRLDKTIDDGGFTLAGGFTKNFRYDCKVDKTEVGNSFTIAVTGVSKTSEYPIYVDFAITYIGEYENEYSDVRTVRAKEAKIKAAEKKAGETFTFADMGTKTFDMDNFAYCEDTGFYHRYSMALYGDDPLGYGAGYGPILCCAISKSIACYSVAPSLYSANDVGPNHSNYLKLYNCWLEDEKKYVVLDYTEFIRTDYYGKCNKDGVCYVTGELKNFLQDYAVKQVLYSDGAGKTEGTPEDKGYFAKQDALWLFACGFYTK